MDRVSKTFPGGKQVLKDIHLSFLPGAKIGVLGEPIYRIRSCTGLKTTNLAYGEAEGRDLYITEGDLGLHPAHPPADPWPSAVLARLSRATTCHQGKNRYARCLL